MLQTNRERFVFVDETGKSYDIDCYTTSTRVRVTEHAVYTDYTNGYWYPSTFEGKDYWYNRPWYRFTYEKALKDLAEKMAGNNKARLKCFMTCIDNKARTEAEACQSFVEAFKKDYNSLCDTTKKHLANANITITSEKQAKDIMAVSKAFDLLFRVEEKEAQNKGGN